MHNKKHMLLLMIIAAIGYVSLMQNSNATQDKRAKVEQSRFKTEAYIGQTHVTCNGTTINIPPFNSINHDNLFLRFSDRECSKDNIEIFVGIGSDCNGVHACYVCFFSKQKLSDGYIGAALDDVLSQNLTEIKLDKNITGYFIPIKVRAYPTPSRLIWLDRGYVYVVGSKGGTHEELVESANAYIGLRS